MVVVGRALALAILGDIDLVEGIERRLFRAKFVQYRLRPQNTGFQQPRGKLHRQRVPVDGFNDLLDGGALRIGVELRREPEQRFGVADLLDQHAALTGQGTPRREQDMAAVTGDNIAALLQLWYTRYVNGQKIKHTIKPVLGETAPHNRKVVYSLDFTVTPHQLRHAYITNLIHANVDPKTVQYLAGHENSKITMDIYAKVKYNRPKELAAAVNGAFGQASRSTAGNLQTS